MTPGALVVAYLTAGLAAAALVLFRSRPRSWASVGSAAAAFALWPLWLPFALAPARERGPARREREAVQGISLAVARARDAVRGTDLEGALTARDAEAILQAVDRIGGRLDAIEGELAASAGPARRVTRLVALQDADRAALDEVRELAEMLATELTLARHGRGDGVEPLIVELRARVEALQNS
ncbi:MAG: hypothetical protein HS104_33160 [Polyangiaceae bacterium]|nr:hypothetical protein [Polyangiaceae bacterium]MCL4755028.1 hypothetical protein [Myxococcales bacterium]